MNRFPVYIVFFAFALLFVASCDKNNDKATEIVLGEYESDYGELAEKYATMEFATCADAISAGNEIVAVFYATSDKAFKENDAKAKSDLEHFGELLSDFGAVEELMYSKCPEDFDQWEKDNRKKIDAILYKVERMFDSHAGDTEWSEDVSSEIDAVNEQVEQLMIDIQRLTEEEDSAIM